MAQSQKLAWRTKRKRKAIGSTNLDVYGYTRVKTHEANGKEKNWFPEHRVVMQQAIGRQLTRGEIVHHINGVRTDNRADNLYLCNSPSHHFKVEWSMKDIVRQLLEQVVVVFDRENGRYVFA